MAQYGFLRTAAAVPAVRLADTEANVTEICILIGEACGKAVSLIVFPELSVTGYSCGDLFGQECLIAKAEEGIREIMEFSRGKQITVVVGTPVPYRGRLYDCAAVIRNGNIKGLVPKVHTQQGSLFASGRDFLDARMRNDGKFLDNAKDCFRNGFGGVIRFAGQKCNISPNLLFSLGDIVFGVEIGSDLLSPVPQSSHHALAGAQLIANLSASPEAITAHSYRHSLVTQQSARTVSGYIYSSAGHGESTRDMVYGGASMIYENGRLLAEGGRFSRSSSLVIADMDCSLISGERQRSVISGSVFPDGTSDYSTFYTVVELGKVTAADFSKSLYRTIDRHPFVPCDEAELASRCMECVDIQVSALASRLGHIGCRSAVIGISGGLDSTLALLVTVLAADRLGWSRDRIVGITMPGYGTTERTRSNAEDLMGALGVTSRRISITAACDRHFQDIEHDKSVHDVTFENAQARERTQILMDVANQTGGIVVGTGDLSELALGWATYNGDHMSMYGVNAGVPKTMIRHIVTWAAEHSFPSEAFGGKSVKDILMDIVDTPISPELLPADENGKIAQVTEDLVGPYELHDFFLYHFVRLGYSPAKIFFLAKKAFCSTEATGNGLAAGENAGTDRESRTAYSEETVKKWLTTFIRRFFGQQFKRSCLPDGPAVGSVSLSPRGAWDMPSDAFATTFLKELE